jgi:hypothetical protein
MVTVVMLTTTGAKTGQLRTVPVLGIPTGSTVAIIASNFGQERRLLVTRGARIPAASVGTEIPSIDHSSPPMSRRLGQPIRSSTVLGRLVGRDDHTSGCGGARDEPQLCQVTVLLE